MAAAKRARTPRQTQQRVAEDSMLAAVAHKLAQKDVERSDFDIDALIASQYHLAQAEATLAKLMVINADLGFDNFRRQHVEKRAELAKRAEDAAAVAQKAARAIEAQYNLTMAGRTLIGACLHYKPKEG